MLHLPRPMPARLAFATASTALLVMACSSTKQHPTGSGPSRPAANPAAGAQPNPASSASTSAVDACSLLTARDVSAVIGSPTSGPTSSAGNDTDTSQCSWTQEIKSPYSFKAIHLSVSGANTAAGDQLPPPALGTPPPVPGIGGGARLLLVGTIQFPAGGRVCQVQVVGLADDAAKQAAITLAGLVRGRA